MKYERHFYDSGETVEITYEKALKVLLGTWNDNEMTRSMLTIPNKIQCRGSMIYVSSDDGRVLMAGLYNMVPDDVWAKYNPDGTPK